MTVRIPSPYGNMAGAPQELMAAYLRDPRLAMAQRSLQEGSSTAPLQGGWMEGLARLGQGLWGGYQQGQVGREYEDQSKAYRETLAAALRAKTPEEREAILGGNALTQGPALERQMARSDRALEMEAENKAALARMGIGVRDDGTYYMLPGFGEAKGGVAAAEAGQMIPVKVKEAEAMIAPKVAEQGALMPGKVREAEGVAAAEFPYRARAAAAGRSVTVVNTGSNGIDYGDPPKDMAWARNPDGTVMLDERGVPLARSIQGTDLFLKTQDKTAEAAGNVAKVSDKTARRTRAGGRVLEKLDKIEKAVEGGLSGLRGVIEPAIPGTSGKGIKNDIDTVRATIGGDILQIKRDESTSGASGYGQLTIQELDRFEKQLGSLDLSQPAASILENVRNIRDEYIATMERDAEERARLGLPPISGGGAKSTAAPAISGDPTKMSPEEIYNELRSMDE